MFDKNVFVEVGGSQITATKPSNIIGIALH
jgi:hypothetical protein